MLKKKLKDFLQKKIFRQIVLPFLLLTSVLVVFMIFNKTRKSPPPKPESYPPRQIDNVNGDYVNIVTYDGYEMNHDFYNTVRRKDSERIIVFVRNGKVVQETVIIDENGKEIKRSSEILHDGVKPKRNNEFLRTGDELQNGDIIAERFIKCENEIGICKEQDIWQDGETTTVKADLKKEIEYINDQKTTILSKEAYVINKKRYLVQEIMDSKGAITRRVIDEENKEIGNNTILFEETILKNNKLYLSKKKVIDGNIIAIDEFLRDMKAGDRAMIDESGIFRFIENTDTGLTAEDEKKISQLKRKRNQINSRGGTIKFLGASAEEIAQLNEKFTRGNLDKDFSQHQVPTTTATYPVDLSRVLTADKDIPAVLITAINSEIPANKITAMVEEDVFSKHGDNILIPKGSMAIGAHEGANNKESRRIAVIWRRIITPDGINIKLEGEMLDQEGASGMTGKVDKRMMDKYGAALLFSSINALGQMSIDVNDEKQRVVVEGFGEELGQLTATALKENINIKPIISIPKGARINISSMQDIWFKEPKGNVIEAKPI